MAGKAFLRGSMVSLYRKGLISEEAMNEFNAACPLPLLPLHAPTTRGACLVREAHRADEVTETVG
jgi:hypothetical protein